MSSPASPTSDELQIVFSATDGRHPCPTRQYEADAGFDLTAHLYRPLVIPSMGYDRVPVGVSIQFPRGWHGLIVGRSGLMDKYQLLVVTGVIDSQFTGEVCVMVQNLSKEKMVLSPDMRIAQLLIYPTFTPGGEIPKMPRIALKGYHVGQAEPKVSDSFVIPKRIHRYPDEAERGRGAFGSTSGAFNDGVWFTTEDADGHAPCDDRRDLDHGGSVQS